MSSPATAIALAGNGVEFGTGVLVGEVPTGELEIGAAVDAVAVARALAVEFACAFDVAVATVEVPLTAGLGVIVPSLPASLEHATAANMKVKTIRSNRLRTLQAIVNERFPNTSSEHAVSATN